MLARTMQREVQGRREARQRINALRRGHASVVGLWLAQIALATTVLMAGGLEQQRCKEWTMRAIVLRAKSEQPAFRVVFRKGLA